MSGEPTLSQHHANDPEWTAHLQGLLAQQGYDPGPADGIFGSRTAAAVRQFQFDRGLAADGIVGDQTWASLGGGSAPPNDQSAPEGAVEPEWSGGSGDGGSDVLGQQPGSNPNDIEDWALPHARVWIKRFRHHVDVEVENYGAGIWEPGQVAIVVRVERYDEGTVVQETNQEIVGMVPGEFRPLTFPFLGFDVPGRYTATVTLYDIVRHKQLDSTYEMNTFPQD